MNMEVVTYCSHLQIKMWEDVNHWILWKHFPGPCSLTKLSSFWAVCECVCAQSCLALCDPEGCSASGLPVHHRLPELTQTHVHWVGDAIQPSHPLLSPFPPTFNLSQHQSLFKWISFSHHVAKGLELQLHHQSCQWMFRTDFLYSWLVWSFFSLTDSQESFTSTTV